MIQHKKNSLYCVMKIKHREGSPFLCSLLLLNTIVGDSRSFYVFSFLLLCKSHHLKLYHSSTILASPSVKWNLISFLPEVLHQSVNLLLIYQISGIHPWKLSLSLSYVLWELHLYLWLLKLRNLTLLVYCLKQRFFLLSFLGFKSTWRHPYTDYIKAPWLKQSTLRPNICR